MSVYNIAMAALLAVLLAFTTDFSFAFEILPSEPPENFPTLQFRVKPTYHSTGLRLGHVLNLRGERPVLPSYEGEMMLGFGANPAQVTDQKCVLDALDQSTKTTSQEAAENCFLFKNPLPFSFLSDLLFSTLLSLKGSPLVIYFANYDVAPSPLLTKTQNLVNAVFPIQLDLRIDARYRIPTWKKFHPQAEHLVGRVVQASVEASLRKTYEIIVQEGEHADNFRALSVNDRGLFNYITQAMLSGRLLNVEYVGLNGKQRAQLSPLFNFMMHYRVIAVELLGESF